MRRFSRFDEIAEFLEELQEMESQGVLAVRQEGLLSGVHPKLPVYPYPYR